MFTVIGICGGRI